mgnify:CR=1 FL=1|jgi:hypothetical protein
MEALTQLMSLIDLNSKSLPEGEYLKACNYMKDIYKDVRRPTSPEAHLPRIRTPRRLLDSDSESESDDEDFQVIPNYEAERTELAGIGTIIQRYQREIKGVQSRLKYLKIKQRITANVKRDAVRERAQQLGIRLRTLTMEELRAKGHHVPNERNFYKGYLERQNLITRDLVADLNGDLLDLNQALEATLARREQLQTLLFGAPLR